MTPTPTDMAVLQFIEAEKQRREAAPTIREICHQFGWASTHAAWLHVQALRQDGLIEMEDGKCRTIRITRLGQQCLSWQPAAHKEK